MRTAVRQAADKSAELQGISQALLGMHQDGFPQQGIVPGPTWRGKVAARNARLGVLGPPLVGLPSDNPVTQQQGDIRAVAMRLHQIGIKDYRLIKTRLCLVRPLQSLQNCATVAQHLGHGRTKRQGLVVGPERFVKAMHRFEHRPQIGVGLRQAGLMRDGSLVIVHGRRKITQRLVRQSAVVVREGKSGLQADGFVVTCQGLRVALQAIQRKTPAGMCLSMPSREPNRCIETSKRTFKLPPR